MNFALSEDSKGHQTSEKKKMLILHVFAFVSGIKGLIQTVNHLNALMLWSGGQFWPVPKPP